MDLLWDFLSLVGGAALILVGADWLTDSATGLARRFNVPEMVIGLTVVAFGTSLPELVASLTSAIQGCSGLSIGNIVGSNIFNVLAIVGCSALCFPIAIGRSTLQKDLPFTLLASFVIAAMVFDSVFDAPSRNMLTRVEGLTLLGFFMVFMFYTFSMARDKNGSCASDNVPLMSYGKILMLFIIGLAGLVVGGNLFVGGASSIALAMGVSETVVGLTLMAAGTSLPELATSIVAARKGCSAIAVGNVIGSNIFNIFFVLGTCATITPLPVGDISYMDIGLMILSLGMMWIFAFTKRTIERWEGAVMVVAYLAYLTCLVVQA